MCKPLVQSTNIYILGILVPEIRIEDNNWTTHIHIITHILNIRKDSEFVHFYQNKKGLHQLLILPLQHYHAGNFPMIIYH